MKDIIIAIDPDSERDGVAILQPAKKDLVISAAEFGETLHILSTYNRIALSTNKSLVILIEAGWLNKGNYHLLPHDSRAVIAAKGVSQGRNHQRGLDIESFCKYNRMPYELVKPLIKRSSGFSLWSGKDGKITQHELEAIVGHALRCKDKNLRPCMPNQEARDAALIAWTYAGLPIRVKR